jgi:hypothetical protein
VAKAALISPLVLALITWKRDQLEGKIQERYGLAKDQVAKDVDTWYDSQTW